jgi:hypothetical protein
MMRGGWGGVEDPSLKIKILTHPPPPGSPLFTIFPSCRQCRVVSSRERGGVSFNFAWSWVAKGRYAPYVLLLGRSLLFKDLSKICSDFKKCRSRTGWVEAGMCRIRTSAFDHTRGPTQPRHIEDFHFTPQSKKCTWEYFTLQNNRRSCGNIYTLVGPSYSI